MSLGSALAWLVCAALFGMLGSAQAATFCVSTPAQLSDAIELSQFSQGTNSVRLRPGVYSMPNGVAFQNLFGGNLYVSGDWNAGCTTRGQNPFATVIDGGSGGNSAWFLQSGSTDVNLTLLHFTNVNHIGFYDWHYDCEAQGQHFRIDRSVIDGENNGQDRVAYNGYCHDVEILSSLIIGGAGRDAINIELTEDVDEPPSIRLVHNTVISAQSHGLTIDADEADALASVQLYNNIIYGHGETDVLLRHVYVTAIGNNWAEITINGGGGLSPASSNNVTSNPQLLLDGRPIEPFSSVINTASISIPGGLPSTDLEGNPRLIGSAPDRGAFETDVSNATVLTVTDPNDSGPGTLRQAIITANASPGAQIITFNIPGACPQSIFLQSPLPSLTDAGLLLINGETQPGSSANTLDDGNNAVTCVQLRKSAQVGSVAHAIRVPPGSNAFLILRGIAFGGFLSAIDLAGGSGHLIQGNRFGEPQHLGANSAAVQVGAGSSGVKIGGSASPAYRNTIANSSFAGIFVNGSSDVEIGNNYIGTDSNGLAARANNVGVYVFNSVGTRAFSNVISGNTLSGLILAGSATSDSVVTDNHIGVSRDTPLGTFPRGNGSAGVAIIAGAHDNRIGGTFRNTSNIIAINGGDGVEIESGQRNTISSNRIYGNGGLGIDLAADGVTPNNNDASPIPLDYANRGLNFPVLVSAAGGDASGTVSGTLSTTRGGYRIELFMNAACDTSGHGQGSRSIGSTQVIIPNLPGQHMVAFSAAIQSATAELSGAISATATDSSGNTSEFSACVPYDSSDLIFADGFEAQSP